MARRFDNRRLTSKCDDHIRARAQYQRAKSEIRDSFAGGISNCLEKSRLSPRNRRMICKIDMKYNWRASSPRESPLHYKHAQPVDKIQARTWYSSNQIRASSAFLALDHMQLTALIATISNRHAHATIVRLVAAASKREAKYHDHHRALCLIFRASIPPRAEGDYKCLLSSAKILLRLAASCRWRSSTTSRHRMFLAPRLRERRPARWQFPLFYRK